MPDEIEEKDYTVSLTISVIGCRSEEEAIKQFEEVLADKRYDRDSIEVEEEVIVGE